MEQTVKSYSAQSEKQIQANCIKAKKLLDHSYMLGEHEALKEHMEHNPVQQTLVGSLEYGMELVTSKTRTMSKVAPTMKMLLRNGAKWDRPDRLVKCQMTPYHVICGSTGDHQELLELMIKELGRTLINAKDYKDCTALMRAVQNANVKCVESLIANGADVNLMKNKFIHSWGSNVSDMINYSSSPLIDSISMLRHNSQCSHDTMMKIIDILLENGADVNQPCCIQKCTPVMYAAVVGNVNCAKKLIQRGAKLDCADKYGNLLCTLAARIGNVEMLKCLLEDTNIDKNSIDAKRRSVLYWAVSSGNIEAVRYLLSLRVKITSYIPQGCMTTCELCGTNVPWHGITNEKEASDPYILAISSNMIDAVRLMDEYGCQLYKAVEILNFAISVGSVEMVDYFLCRYKYSLNYEYINIETLFVMKHSSNQFLHQTLLINSFTQNSVKVITLLLKHGADPNKIVCAERCPSALNIAINKQHVEVIALFIRGGVNVNTRSYNVYMGMMLPFEVAVKKKHIYAAEMLLVSGCSHGVHSFDNNDNHRLKINIKRRVRKLLKKWNVDKNTVLPLRQRCRMVILNHLSPQADQRITELPLPPQIIRYLSIPELDDIIEAKCKPSSKCLSNIFSSEIK